MNATLRHLLGLVHPREPCRGDTRPSTRPIRLISGDFDLDLFRLGLFALGQMDL